MDDGKRLEGNGLSLFWDTIVDYIDEYIEAHGGGITPSEGTVKSILGGEGIAGGLITTRGKFKLKPATESNFGGIYIRHDKNNYICYIDTIR